jgi:broad specificity phosphatase PhoE
LEQSDVEGRELPQRGLCRRFHERNDETAHRAAREGDQRQQHGPAQRSEDEDEFRPAETMISKTIVCIRHGQSTFNEIHPKCEIDPLYYDAPLSELGHRQVLGAQQRLHERAIDLVITSPLTRALQTAAGLFANHPSSPPMLVESLHCERVENSCDIGRAPASLAKEFPAFAFEHLPTVWWHNGNEPDERGISVEPIEMVEIRAREFRRMLLLRPEHVIAVVGHGTFFRCLTGQTLANCEVIEFVLEI